MTFDIIITCIPIILSLVVIYIKFFGKSGPYKVKLRDSETWIEVSDLGSKEDLRKLRDSIPG